MDQFAPFERLMKSYRDANGGKVPTRTPLEWFREGYMLALKDGHVTWRDDRAMPKRGTAR